jgi:hypothetical protein
MTAAVRPISTPHVLEEHGETGVADDIPRVNHDPGIVASEGGALPELPRDEFVDLRTLKRVARNLPETDPVRLLIEGEPDRLPRAILAAKADSWVLLLLRGG